jgi:hypothetical protein
MIITIEVKKDNKSYVSVDTINSLVVIHAYEALSSLNETLEDLKKPERQAMGGSTIGITNKVYFNMKLNNINRDKFYDFIKVYSDALYENYLKNPLEYAMGYDITLNNMTFAIAKGSFNKDSESFKKACKVLKIKNTYKAIDEFLERKV